MDPVNLVAIIIAALVGLIIFYNLWVYGPVRSGKPAKKDDHRLAI
jgi:hypothetical protein